jgi:copper chaperone CopZ
MVCNRCIKVVKDELENLSLHPESVQLGEVVLKEEEKSIDKGKIKAALSQYGFELLDDKKSYIIEKIKKHNHRTHSLQWWHARKLQLLVSDCRKNRNGLHLSECFIFCY